VETKSINPYQGYLCQGVVNFRDWPYRCWKEHGHGWADMTRALIESCDIYFYRTGVKTTVDALNRYSLMFGLGEKRGVDLPGERSGLVPSAPWKRKRYGSAWYYGNTIQMSIGQGFLLATPLQLACLMAAFAADGTLYRPHVLKELREPQGKLIRAYKSEVSSTLLVSERSKKIIKRALWGVVNIQRGTGGRARLRSIAVAGKTSTAENPHGEPHAGFVCYAPADEPSLVVMVMLENGGEGGSVAAPIAKYLLENYFNLRHDREIEEIREMIRQEMSRG
jgi:penicillin-binding protein 2